MFKQYWMEFVCGLIITALTGAVAFLWAKVKRGYHLVKEEEKEDYLSDVNNRLSKDENKLATLEKSVTDLKKELKDDIKNVLKTIELIREGMLSSHLDNLVQECKGWIKKGWIPLDSLERFEEKYSLYRALGGNGHMEPWASRVRELPNKPPVE